MRIIVFIFLFFVGAASIAAQDKKNVVVEAPEEVRIPAADVASLDEKSRLEEVAKLKFENLKLKIEKAQRDLKDLQYSAQKATKEVLDTYFAAIEKAGIPRAKLSEYEVIQNEDKTLTLRRKKQP